MERYPQKLVRRESPHYETETAIVLGIRIYSDLLANCVERFINLSHSDGVQVKPSPVNADGHDLHRCVRVYVDGNCVYNLILDVSVIRNVTKNASDDGSARLCPAPECPREWRAR